METPLSSTPPQLLQFKMVPIVKNNNSDRDVETIQAQQFEEID